jgi:hypothetical protein
MNGNSATIRTWPQRHQNYLETCPEPQPINFGCSRCSAPPGTECVGRPHANRADKAARARRLRLIDAANYADDLGAPTDKHIRYLRRTGAVL